MLETLFKETLLFADNLRPQYTKSLGNNTGNWNILLNKIINPIPELYTAIYKNVSGTFRDVTDQSLMDYIPGYRLIHVLELENELKNMSLVLSDNACADTHIVLPMLANYSSDFICYYNNRCNELICLLTHDTGSLTVMHNSPENFFKTVCEFYKQNVYFLDSDGYLDYDLNKEAAVASILNPGIPYWL